MFELFGYKINKKIRSEASTDVYQAMSSENECQVIVRHFRNTQFSDQFCHIQQQLGASNIVGLESIISCFKQKTDLIVISEDNGAEPLAQKLAAHTFALEDTLKIIVQLNRILGDLHVAGYVHKNISDQSVLITSDNNVTLSGLEFCSICNTEKSIFSNTSQIEGSIAYLSPEQTGRMNRSVDYRSDYYSLGMLMYQMLTGVLPCHSTDPMAAIYCHIALKPEPASRLNPRIPNVVSLIVLKLLEKNAENRYQSTLGIEGDLKDCIEQLTQTGVIVDFPLARDDFSERLLFSEKLYGREEPLKLLLRESTRVANGEKRVVYVEGASGTGKTGLMSEFLQLVFSNQFLCLEGKFDQQEDGQPYSAFIQVFESFIRIIENKTPEDQRLWKEKIKADLQSSLSVLTGFSSCMAKYFGALPKTDVLGVSETKNHFNAAIFQFIRSISSKETPVVMVVDDLHWADAASVELFSKITHDESIKYLMLIGVYRDNEVGKNVFLKHLLLSQNQAPSKSEKLTLKNLKQNEVLEIVQDVLREKSERVTALSTQIFDETQGNPYFVKQLLFDLRASNYFQFNKNKSAWAWQVIPALSESKNIIELIDARLNRLTDSEQMVLKYAALLGSRFFLKKLKLICPISVTEFDLAIIEFVNNNFLFYLNDEYRFTHDRVQESVIALSDEHEQREIHYHIGISLLNSASEKEQYDQIYNIVSHLNYAVDFKKDDRDFISRLRDLNLLAAKRASGEAAYIVSAEFARQAASLLEEDAWKNTFDDAFNIYFELAKSQYLIGEPEKALVGILDVLGNISSLDKQVKSFSLLKDIYTNQGLKYDDLLEHAITILASSGEELSIDPILLNQAVDIETQKVNAYFSRNEIDSILTLPLSENKKTELLVHFYMELWEAAYYAGRIDLMRFCVLRMVSESLVSGNTELSSFGYVSYASILSAMGNYEAAYSFGKVALALNKSFSNKILIPKLNNLFCNYTSFHKARFSESANLYHESFQVAQQTGDYLFGVWASYFYIWSLFLSGENLNKVLEKSEKHLLFVKQTNDEKMYQSYTMLQSFIRYYIDSERYDVREDKKNTNYVESWIKDGFLPGPAWYAILIVQRYYLDKQYDKALNIIDTYCQNLNAEIVMFPLSQLNFYHALCVIEKTKSIDGVLSKDNETLVLDAQKVIDELAEFCPENFSYQKYLLMAEYAVLKEDPIAAQYFDEANSAAILYESYFVKALCYERQAVFLHENGLSNESAKALEDAAYFYNQWGAVDRSEALLLKTSDIDSVASLHSTEDFELNSLVRASQAISSEIDMDRLLMKMLSIALEDSYAEYGLLFLVQDEQIYLAAENKKGQSHVYLNKKITLDSFDDVAKTVIEHVYLHGVDVVIGDAKNYQEFCHDPYVRRTDASSLLCCPVSIRGHMVAIIYLENTLSVDVFKIERLPYFHNLLSQLAISLENARLYSGLKAEVDERKSVEAALRLSESRMRLSHHYANAGTWESDFVNHTLYWSEGTKVIFGIPVDSKIESINSFYDAIYPSDLPDVKCAIEHCLETGNEYYVEHRIVLPNGQIKWVSESGDVQRDENGISVKMIGLVQDIDNRKTEEFNRKKLEMQLQQSQKMESIGQLTGGIAHDFNNMLASILGFTELSLKTEAATSSPKLNKYLKQILSSGQRARDLVKQMQAFSRNEDSVKEATDIGTLVRESVEMLSTVLTSSIIVKVNIAKATFMSNVNAVQIHQVVMNLCINARDAMKGAGELTISVDQFAMQHRQCASCHEFINGNFVRIQIQDTGEGVPTSVFDKVFEPFFTTKAVGKGTGMGLSMVHGIVHGCGGHILLDSHLTLGSTFTVLLPLISEDEEQDQCVVESNIPLAESSQGLNVLVVDDEVAVATFLVDLLETKGINAKFSDEPEVATEELKQLPEKYDLVIVDQTMPVMSGIELVTQVRASNRHTQFILMTGFDESVNERVAKKAGCIGFLEKPFDISVLFSLIELVDVKSDAGD